VLLRLTVARTRSVRSAFATYGYGDFLYAYSAKTAADAKTLIGRYYSTGALPPHCVYILYQHLWCCVLTGFLDCRWWVWSTCPSTSCC